MAVQVGAHARTVARAVDHTGRVAERSVPCVGAVIFDPAGRLLLIQRGAATQVTSLLYLVPPVTALMAWLTFGEPLTSSMVLGMALTAVGVALVVRTPVR